MSVLLNLRQRFNCLIGSRLVDIIDRFFRLLPKQVFIEAQPRAAEDLPRRDDPAEIVADVFRDGMSRFELERLIETKADLPRGSVVIHCPSYSGPRKIASILVFASNSEGDGRPVPLREIGELFGMFKGHQVAINALENMYSSMWRLVVSVAPPFYIDYARLSVCIEKALVDYLVSKKRKFGDKLQIKNDPTMLWELEQAALEAQTPELVTDRLGAARVDTGVSIAFAQFASSAIMSAVSEGRMPCPTEFDGWPEDVVDAVSSLAISQRELDALFFGKARFASKKDPKVAEVQRLKDELILVAAQLPKARKTELRRELGELLIGHENARKVASPQLRKIAERLREIIQRYKGV